MASALDRLLKKYTLEDSGSGDAGLLKKPATTAPAPTPAPVAPAAPSLLAAGTPEYEQWWNQYKSDWYDPVSMGSKVGSLYESDPLGNLGDWRGNDSTLSRAGAVNVAFDPAKNEFVGMDSSGKPIESTRGSTLTDDTDFYNAALAMMAIPAAYVAAGAGGAGAAGGSGAGAGAADTYMLGAANAAVPAATDTYMLGAAGGAGAGAGASDAYMAGAAGAGAGGGSGAGAAAGSAASGLTSTPSSGTVSTPSASGSWLDDIAAWMKDPKNAEVAKLLFGATGAALGGTGGSSGGGYSYSGPMPTISRQGWSPTAQQQTMLGGPSMGMLDVKPGEAMSGLWRYGLLGGGGK